MLPLYSSILLHAAAGALAQYFTLAGFPDCHYAPDSPLSQSFFWQAVACWLWCHATRIALQLWHHNHALGSRNTPSHLCWSEVYYLIKGHEATWIVKLFCITSAWLCAETVCFSSFFTSFLSCVQPHHQVSCGVEGTHTFCGCSSHILPFCWTWLTSQCMPPRPPVKMSRGSKRRFIFFFSTKRPVSPLIRYTFTPLLMLMLHFTVQMMFRPTCPGPSATESICWMFRMKGSAFGM